MSQRVYNARTGARAYTALKAFVGDEFSTAHNALTLIILALKNMCDGLPFTDYYKAEEEADGAYMDQATICLQERNQGKDSRIVPMPEEIVPGIPLYWCLQLVAWDGSSSQWNGTAVTYTTIGHSEQELKDLAIAWMTNDDEGLWDFADQINSIGFDPEGLTWEIVEKLCSAVADTPSYLIFPITPGKVTKFNEL
jgi:hypothetical protein